MLVLRFPEVGILGAKVVPIWIPNGNPRPSARTRAGVSTILRPFEGEQSQTSFNKADRRLFRTAKLKPPTEADEALSPLSRCGGRRFFFLFAGGNAHDANGIADYVGGALLAFRSGRHLHVRSA